MGSKLSDGLDAEYNLTSSVKDAKMGGDCDYKKETEYQKSGVL